MALLLDPRMKGGVWIPNTDKEFIWARIRDKLVLTLQLREEEIQAQPEQANNNHVEHLINHAAANQQNDLDIMLEDLNQYYMQEHQQQEQQKINGEHVINNNVDQRQHLINVANAEVLLYQ
jgi:hypothetical protein